MKETGMWHRKRSIPLGRWILDVTFAVVIAFTLSAVLAPSLDTWLFRLLSAVDFATGSVLLMVAIWTVLWIPGLILLALWNFVTNGAEPASGDHLRHGAKITD
jgi:uncharacterized membrane protein YdjX (TVP38/TMEM64 family)